MERCQEKFFDGRLKKLGLSRSHWLVKSLLELRNQILKKAQAFCPISTDTQREFLEAGVPKQQIRLVPNVYDNTRFNPASSQEKYELRKSLSIHTERVVAIFTGRLVSWKGPQHLVRVWHRISENRIPPLLLLVGPDGNDIFDCSDEIREYIATNSLQENIVMTGGVRNVEDYMRASDFFVFPSQGGEGLTTAVMEAMGCGLPVVTTNATGLTDLVSPDVGIVVDTTNFQDFQDAVLALYTDEQRRLTLGRAAMERASHLYAPERAYPQYLQLFRSLFS